MSKIRYVNGDLLRAPEVIIGHGCNARGVMGSGIAKAIRDRYPSAYQVYRDEYERNGLQLGTVIPWVGDDRIVLNFITQEAFGRTPGMVYVDYDAVRQCMQRLEKAAQRHQSDGSGHFAKHPQIALPRIGAGLGGGDWDRIASIIEEEVRSIAVTVYSI